MKSITEFEERYENKLRAYERTHKTWMESSIFNEEARVSAVANLDQARTEYEYARQAYVDSQARIQTAIYRGEIEATDADGVETMAGQG